MNGESIAQKSCALVPLLNPPCLVHFKPWGLVLKKYRQVGRWVTSIGPAMIASLCSMKIGLSMTVRYRGHHCTQLRLGVVSPELAEMAGFLPSLACHPH